MNRNRTYLVGRDHSLLAVARARQRGQISTEGNEVNKGLAQMPNNKKSSFLCLLAKAFGVSSCESRFKEILNRR
jgi:hypothetical protein